MDQDKLDTAPSEGEESEKYLWLAALIIGILLILMLLAIVAIVIWKHLKKDNTTHQNWAGPSPLTHDDITINECILSRQRSHSSASTAPIVPNEQQAPQKLHGSENTAQEHFEEASIQEENKTNIMPTLPYISSETTSFSSHASEGKAKQNNQDFTLNETALPPPPDDFVQFPMPPPIEELPVIGEEKNLQPVQITDVSK